MFEEMSASELSIKGFSDANDCNSGPEKENSGAGTGNFDAIIGGFRVWSFSSPVFFSP